MKEQIAKLKKQLKESQTANSLLQKEHDALKSEYRKLALEHEGSKQSFRMVKNNFEREKTRLDMALETALNTSKLKTEKNVLSNRNECMGETNLRHT